jgi:hypothetical protein
MSSSPHYLSHMKHQLRIMDAQATFVSQHAMFEQNQILKSVDGTTS